MENKFYFHENADEQYRSAVNDRVASLACTYEGCVAVDKDARIIAVNDNYLKLVEKNRDEIWNKPILKISEQSNLPEIVETGEPKWFYPLEYKLQKEKKYILASGYPLRDRSNRVIGAIGIVVLAQSEPFKRLIQDALKEERPRAPRAENLNVFISHAQQDLRLAQKLSEQLRGHGISTFPSAENLKAGSDWQQEIEKAINLANAVIVLVDPKRQPDNHQRFEWSTALEEAWKDPSKRLIPFLLGNSELPSFLSHRQVLRVRNPKKEWGRAVAELIHVLKNDFTESGEFVSVEQEDPSKRSDRLRDIEEAAQIESDHIKMRQIQSVKISGPKSTGASWPRQTEN
jgi:TIR domain/PAS fold